MPKADVKLDKTVMVQHMGRIYVGNPKYETFTDKVEEAETIEVLTEIVDAYEFIPIATLIPDARGDMGVLSTFAVIKVGTIVSIPDEAVIAEIANDSPYYREYVKMTSGVSVHDPSEMPHLVTGPAPFKRHRDH